MKEISFAKEQSHFPTTNLRGYAESLLPEMKRMEQASRLGYEDDRASINLCVDEAGVKQVQQLARQYKKVELIVVVGIGGSNLGTVAVQEAILGKLHNLHRKPQILYADTVDSQSIKEIKALLGATLKRRRRALLVAISKSGGTTETIANFEILLQEMKRQTKQYQKNVVIISGEGSRFWQQAEREGFATLPIPEKVGGRYSVFSPVGLFPLAVLGINIKQLLAGAAAMRTRGLRQNLNENWPALSAAILHYHAQVRNIATTLLFATDLEATGKWYRQLMGESIGKEWNRDHTRRIWNGITPSVAVGSTDLHSMAQLWLGGPQDKYITFVTVEEKGPVLPKWKEYEHLVPNIQGKRLSEIMEAIVQGVQAAFVKGKRPYCHLTLQDRSAYSIGQLLQFKMMEMIYLGHLMNVNPFDQPNVEEYKVETKRILSR